MSTRFQPPPTWELPIVLDSHDMPVFSSVWLNWFLELTAQLTADGTPDPADSQNILSNQTYAVRPPTYFAEEAFKQNDQAILAGQIFGA